MDLNLDPASQDFSSKFYLWGNIYGKDWFAVKEINGNLFIIYVGKIFWFNEEHIFCFPPKYNKVLGKFEKDKKKVCGYQTSVMNKLTCCCW